MSNEFQRVMVSLLKGIPFTNCLTDDILVASERTLEEHEAIVQRILETVGQQQYGSETGKKCIFPEEDRMA